MERSMRKSKSKRPPSLILVLFLVIPMTVQAVTISGTVRTTTGEGIEGVIMAFTGVGTVLTNNDGDYSMVVPFFWSGTVFPAKAGWNFDPPNRTYSFVMIDHILQDYIGTQVITQYSIYGFVYTSDGVGLPNVAINTDMGENTYTTTDGSYYLVVPQNWSGVVTPELVDYTFDPPNRNYTNVTGDIGGQDYIANTQAAQSNVTFVVNVPVGTPPNDIIYIAGSFNSWDPGPGATGADGQEHDTPLTYLNDNFWEITLSFNQGETIEYKYTRGDWDKREQDANGEDIANRQLIVPTNDHTEYDDVLSWCDIPTKVESHTDDQMPNKFFLSQNHPNPFNPETTIQFSLPQTSHVSIEIVTLSGRHIETLIDGTVSAGIHNIQWNGSEVPSGIYICRLKAGQSIQTRKMILQK